MRASEDTQVVRECVRLFAWRTSRLDTTILVQVTEEHLFYWICQKATVVRRESRRGNAAAGTLRALRRVHFH